MDSVSTDSTVSSDSMNRSLPYTELIDKERFDKFCSDTQKLSLTTSDVHNLKDQLNIREHDPTGLCLSNLISALLNDLIDLHL